MALKNQRKIKLSATINQTNNRHRCFTQKSSFSWLHFCLTDKNFIISGQNPNKAMIKHQRNAINIQWYCVIMLEILISDDVIKWIDL